MTKYLLQLSALALCAFAVAETAPSSASNSASLPDADNTAATSIEKIAKPKRKIRVRSTFKNADPMSAPDGQSQLPPTDGSRPKSK